MYSNARRRRRSQKRLFAVAAVAAVIVAALAIILLVNRSSMDGSSAEDAPEGTAIERAETPETGEESTAPNETNGERGEESQGPESIRGIYLTSQSASNMDPYLALIERTDVNAAVVDVKDVTGEVMYPSEASLANEIGATREILDLENVVSRLEERDVYSIARVATFEDDILPIARPDLAVTDSATGAQWRNFAGNTWSDPYNREVWEYNVQIAKEAAEAGFDEVQFDYVRFPSDGPMETLSYPSEPADASGNAIADFLEYANAELEPTGVRVAADVFGLAAGDDGAGVGQDIEAFAPHLDVVNPMIYPSHFPVGSYGLDNPNAAPYEVIENAMAEFQEKAEVSNPELEIRPWLQDFDYGDPPYGPAEVETQIQATYDSGATGWLLWNPVNEYSEAALGGGDSGEDSPAESQYSPDPVPNAQEQREAEREATAE